MALSPARRGRRIYDVSFDLIAATGIARSDQVGGGERIGVRAPVVRMIVDHYRIAARDLVSAERIGADFV